MQPQLGTQFVKEIERKKNGRMPINFSLQSKYVEYIKITREPGQNGTGCTLGNLGHEDLLQQKGGLFYHTNWKASLGCARWVCQDQLPRSPCGASRP